MADEDLFTLFERTLACDYDDDAAWEAVDALRARGGREIFDKAAQWLKSPRPLERARAADVLGQLGVGPGSPHACPTQACNLLLEGLLSEQHPRAAASALIALGHIQQARALPMIYRFITHEDAVLRHAVAFALGCFVKDPASHPGLMLLMTDEDQDVRDWATFSLGVWGEVDSTRVRDALVRRLDDSFENVRLEAMVALAKRNDLRVLPVLIEILDAQEDPEPKLIEAACALLDFSDEQHGWIGPDYARALRQSLGGEATPNWQ